MQLMQLDNTCSLSSIAIQLCSKNGELVTHVRASHIEGRPAELSLLKHKMHTTSTANPVKNYNLKPRLGVVFLFEQFSYCFRSA
jgi:hypothetical protein